jgi:hypothetical protein
MLDDLKLFISIKASIVEVQQSAFLSKGLHELLNLLALNTKVLSLSLIKKVTYVGWS